MEFPKYTPYAGQTIQELLSDCDRGRGIDLILGWIKEALLEKGWRGEELSETECLFRAAEELKQEVNNGGYAQFFFQRQWRK